MIDYCYGCKKRHEDFHWQTRTIEVEEEVKGKIVRSTKNVWVCRKWITKSFKSFKSKIENMSTEEVLSGTMHGLPNQFKSSSEDRTKNTVKQERKMIAEVLS